MTVSLAIALLGSVRIPIPNDPPPHPLPCPPLPTATQEQFLEHGNGPEQRRRRLGATKGAVNNLVLLIRFKNHGSRVLPTVDAIEDLMNSVGGDATYAPTGSVRDMFLDNSYGALEMNSVITPWLTCTKTESQVAAAGSALTSASKLETCLDEALEYAKTLYDMDGMFDQDNDGYIDSVTYFHSGYAAENTGTDCYGTTEANRVWSHFGYMASRWEGGGVKVSTYSIASALWGKCDSNVARIGVVVHELGHFLGLPDLYDTTFSGRGIGAFGAMSNVWGENSNQKDIPLMSAWSKMELGWLRATQINDVSDAGTYTICGIGDHQHVLKITYGYESAGKRVRLSH
jgi:M6 family metalloprotease-like protein